MKKKWIFGLLAALSLTVGTVPAAGAMHIMEGYLPASMCVLWGVLCLPFLGVGLASIGRLRRENPKTITLIAMAGAFVFVISSLKIPTVFGSCSHMTGTGLGAILFGPAATAVLGLIVLVFQAVLLGHGGLTTLGANTFSMAIVGPIVAWALFRGLQKLRLPRMVSIFLAATLGDLLTYCVTALQLAIANPAAEGGLAVSAVKFLGVFAPTQLPLAVLEGILTVLIMMALETYAQPELRAIGYRMEAA